MRFVHSPLLLIVILWGGLLVPAQTLAQRVDRGGGAERAAPVAASAESAIDCCLCTRGEDRLCATVTGEVIADCGALQNTPTFRSLMQSSGNVLMGLSCSGRIFHGSECNTQRTGGPEGAICPTPTRSLDTLFDDLLASRQPDISTPPPFRSVTPILGIRIPGLVFSPATEEGGYTIVPFLAQYISAVYRYAVGLVLIAAIVMMIYGGFRYLLGAGLGDIKAGQQIITDAIFGLLVALAAYFLLSVVNPNALRLDAIKLKSIEFTELDLEDAFPHLGGGTGFEDGPTMCVAFDQCPNLELIKIRDVINEVYLQDPERAALYLRKIYNCTGSEMTQNARGACAGALKKKLNATLKPQFLRLLDEWPENSGLLKIGEIYREVGTQFQGFMHLRVPCGSLLSGFPAPRTTCPQGGHGNATGMDIWFMPAGNQHSNNCAEVVPGKPFPKFMADLGWVHLCHEQWHFELSSEHTGARTTNTWNNIPCFDSSNTEDAYMQCVTPPAPST